MKHVVAAASAVTVGMLALAAVAVGAVTGPDTYLCYKAALAKGQPKLPKGTTKSLDDRFGARTFAVTKIAAICNPADRDRAGISNPAVHLESFAIKASRGTPKFVKVDVGTADVFASRTLTITAPATLLDVTPFALGATPPAAFGSDPTSDPAVNRFACYKAKLAKGSPKFAPPASPTVLDDLLPSARQLVVKKVTKVCEPVDEDGATPDAATRTATLVCYAVKPAKGSPKFVKTTVALNAATFAAPHVLVASAPSELCVPAVQASPTPSPTPTPGKLVFVTSTTTTGGFGGTAGADAICAGRATFAGLSGTYKAWVAVTGDGPSTRFTQSAIPYRLVTGTLVANNWSDLADGALAHTIDRDESGGSVFADVWTGTATSGAPLATNCDNFLNGTSAVAGTCGSTFSTGTGWTNSSTPACNLPLRLYCFEQ